ncbi:hypothetical protein PMG11_06417 [Penicillium brasilianum]|uniref:Uncharacterized protein n=1 Tax=Penicillium brasilianum TaxID=104259 RepID=A0A0F7TLS5_PENBI|nr:hypothetical protein PMG11_06417 [Penicillium brasilianum]
MSHNESNENEALVRVRLNQFLGLTLGFAKELHIVKEQPEEKALSWGYEAPLRSVARVGRKSKTLSGRPDYALWYGDEVALETNLVIVEAKTSLTIGAGEKQLLAYMGLVHSGRKELKKHDITVHGILTDSRAFHFYRIVVKAYHALGSGYQFGYHHYTPPPYDHEQGIRPYPTATGRASMMSGGRQSMMSGKTLTDKGSTLMEKVATGTKDRDTEMRDVM